jgi:hypothetical protein
VGTCWRALAWNRPESLWAVGGVVGAALSGAVYPLLALLLALMMATFFICTRGGDWCCPTEREVFIDNLLVRFHFIIEMILVDRPCAIGV